MKDHWKIETVPLLLIKMGSAKSAGGGGEEEDRRLFFFLGRVNFSFSIFFFILAMDLLLLAVCASALQHVGWHI